MDNDVSRFREKINSFKNDPLAIVVLVSFLTGGGVTTGINGLSNPRPDPYTGTEARAENDAAKRERDRESEDRKAEDNRLRESIQSLSTRIDRCETSQNAHNAEVREWIAISKRNTDIIMDNQRKAHTHRWQVESDKSR